MNSRPGRLYEPLGNRQIRILTLKPRNEAGTDKDRHTEDDTISCFLQTVSLDDKPTYHALSYVWGDAFKLKEIRVNNQPLDVTINLFQALTCLRLENEDRVLWIDAICINQKDNEEKSRQVRLMKEIYGHTNRLLIWLGPATNSTAVESNSNNSGLAMDLIRRVGSILPRTTSEKALVEGDKIILKEIASQPNSNQWDAFVKLCEHQWFTRGWIIQELMLPFREEKLPDSRTTFVATPKEIICGGESASWLHFVRLRIFTARNHRLSYNKLNWYITRAPFEMIRPEGRPTAYQKRSAAIRDLVFEYRYQTVTDLRDRIYAFLGLATDIQENDIKVDYNSSEATVYVDFAIFLLTRNQFGSLPLKLLSACYRIPQEIHQDIIRAGLCKEDEAQEKQYNKIVPKRHEPLHKLEEPKRTRVEEFDERLAMPSWVPDWTINPPYRPLLVFEDILETTCSFNATTRMFPPRHVQVSEDKKILTVQGIIIDRIQELGIEGKKANWLKTRGSLDHLLPILTPEQLVQNFLIVAEYARAMYLSWEEMIERHIPDPYCTRESRDEAYWRTLCADRSMAKPAGSAVEASYRAWKQLYRFGEYKDQIPTAVKTLHEKAELFTNALRLALSTAVRTLFVTEMGKMGITLRGAEKGDVVCLIYGTNVPFVLREIVVKIEEDGKDDTVEGEEKGAPVYYKLIGEAYVHGLMDGEGMRDLVSADTVDFAII